RWVSGALSLPSGRGGGRERGGWESEGSPRRGANTPSDQQNSPIRLGHLQLGDQRFRLVDLHQVGHRPSQQALFVVARDQILKRVESLLDLVLSALVVDGVGKLIQRRLDAPAALRRPVVDRGGGPQHGQAEIRKTAEGQSPPVDLM